MKCPACGAWSIVKDTRQQKGYTTRRRICANEHRFTTKEFLWAVANKDAILKQLKKMT
jgi:transcriptional regulator NrdR family protein